MRRRSLLKIAAFFAVVAPASSFLAQRTARAASSKAKHIRCGSLSPPRASSASGVGIASFEGWLAQQRDAAAAAGPDDAPMLVVDAGPDVDTSFSFSGVAWQVKSYFVRCKRCTGCTFWDSSSCRFYCRPCAPGPLRRVHVRVRAARMHRGGALSRPRGPARLPSHGGVCRAVCGGAGGWGVG